MRYEILSDLHIVETVEDHLQERKQDNTSRDGGDQNYGSVVGIIFLWSCSNGLSQKVMSIENVSS